MISLHLTVSEAEKDSAIAELWERGTIGITEESGGLRAFFDDDVNLAELTANFADLQPVVAEEEAHDWVQESRDAWQPMKVGRTWFLVPEWRDDTAPEGRVRLTIYPGIACGTGWHTATQLCLQAMERWVMPGQRVLDVGTGSGILAHAARLLGASRVVGCDIEHFATVVAAQNTERAGLEVDLFTGSLRSVRNGAFDVAAANLNAAAITQLASEIRRIISTGARVLLAGFREDETEKVCRSLQANPVETLEEDGWACVVIAG